MGDSVDPQRLEGAKWTRAAFEESLRLYPPGWMTARRAKDADVIGGYAIAAGSDVLLCPYTMHRNPKLWDSPRRFDPQRFLSSTTPRNRYAFFPFGGGPQMCIGKTFALLQAQVVLSMVSKRFRFDIAPDHRVVPEALLTLRAKYGIRGHMNPRNTFNTPKDEPALARS